MLCDLLAENIPEFSAADPCRRRAGRALSTSKRNHGNDNQCDPRVFQFASRDLAIGGARAASLACS